LDGLLGGRVFFGADTHNCMHWEAFWVLGM